MGTFLARLEFLGNFLRVFFGNRIFCEVWVFRELKKVNAFCDFSVETRFSGNLKNIFYAVKIY
jgi:hypothetical protein